MLNLIPGLQSTGSAMDAELIRMDVISRNIANAHVTRGPDGLPYQRKVVIFESVLASKLNGGGAEGSQGVATPKVVADTRPPLMVYRGTGHPDADERGMVAMPNVNIHEEMVDLIASSRSYDAKLAVIKSAKAMAQQTLTLGKR